MRTPVPDIEAMLWDRFQAYSEALGRVLKAENPDNGSGKGKTRPMKVEGHAAGFITK